MAHIQALTILDNLNAAAAQIAVLTAKLSPLTPEGVAAIKAEVRIQYARDVLMADMRIEAQS